MNTRKKIIGFDRIVLFNWLEFVVGLVLKDMSFNDVNSELDRFLYEQIKGKEARRKTRTVLMGIWLKVPETLKPFRDEGLALFKDTPSDNHLVLHWGMSMAIYPFFGSIAKHAGRLLRLQKTFSSANLQRRLKEEYGERETVSRALQRTLRSFIDWKVLDERTKMSVFQCGKVNNIDNPKVAGWLIEASLIGSKKTSCHLKSIAESPALFPFCINTNFRNVLASSERMEIVRHGLDDDLVVLNDC